MKKVTKTQTQTVQYTHGGTWPTAKHCHTMDIFNVREGLQCGNCGAVTSDLGKTWRAVK